MPRFDVTLAGELNLDLILYGLPADLPAERELLARRMMLTLGSSAAIVAHNSAEVRIIHLAPIQLCENHEAPGIRFTILSMTAACRPSGR